ncbi:MAG TPA: aspartyl protease family protein [Candidatus Lustribacter sp.]|jgi:hypothetical protein|nr:aspartyl protease family protein [Candidatus Lustribacter sp.]
MIEALVLSLAVTAYGVPGTGTITIDERGRFVRRFDAGPASEGEGWDGRNAWRSDATGMPRVQGDPAERAEILGWSHALRNALEAGKTHALVTSSQDSVDITFAGARRSLGVLVPRTITARSAGNGTWTVTVIAARRVADSPALFALPRPPRDASLSGTITTVPLTLRGNEATVTARINGVPLSVYTDTGGQNVVTESAARRIGLHVVGGGSVAGGGGTATIRYAWANSVRAGNAVMTHQPFIVLPDSAMPGTAAGIIGYELFARFAARFDARAGTLSLARTPAAFGPAVQTVPFGFVDRQPEVMGSLDGVPGAISLDTGSTFTGQVTASFVAQHQLVRMLHARVTAIGQGVGGRYPLYLVRAHSLTLGTVTVDDPLLALLTRPGVWNAGGPIINLGFAMLRRWIFVLDYPNRTIQLRPGGDPSGNLIRDRSGLQIALRGASVDVVSVLAGTPAAEAGITEGLHLRYLNGRRLNKADLAWAQTQLHGQAGTPVTLRFTNGVQRTIVLRRYL